MKKFSFILLYCFATWAIVLFLTSKDDMASDGFLEIGFPSVFYRGFSGKAIDPDTLELGFNLENLLLDLLLVVVIATGIRFIPFSGKK